MGRRARSRGARGGRRGTAVVARARGLPVVLQDRWTGPALGLLGSGARPRALGRLQRRPSPPGRRRPDPPLARRRTPHLRRVPRARPRPEPRRSVEAHVRGRRRPGRRLRTPWHALVRRGPEPRMVDVPTVRQRPLGDPVWLRGRSPRRRDRLRGGRVSRHGRARAVGGARVGLGMAPAARVPLPPGVRLTLHGPALAAALGRTLVGASLRRREWPAVHPQRRDPAADPRLDPRRPVRRHAQALADLLRRLRRPRRRPGHRR